MRGGGWGGQRSASVSRAPLGWSAVLRLHLQNAGTNIKARACESPSALPWHAVGELRGGWWEQNDLSGLRFPFPPPQEERGAIARAQRFLESSVALASDPYTSALTAYVLTLLRSSAAPVALRRLRSLAITQGRCPPHRVGPPRTPRKQFMDACGGNKEASFAHFICLLGYSLTIASPSGVIDDVDCA